MYRYDLTGKTFGRLTVLYYDDTEKKWVCRCACGNTKLTRTYSLTSGDTKSCGCLNREYICTKKRNYRDITGNRYGYLEVIEYVRSGKNGTEWKCYCHKCGSERVIPSVWLKRYKSCGCLSKASARNHAEQLHESISEFNTNVARLKNPEPNKNNKTTGIKGVCQLSNGKYVAYIGFNGKRYTLKRSYDIQKCIEARQEAEKVHEKFLEWYEEYKEKDDDDKGNERADETLTE